MLITGSPVDGRTFYGAFDAPGGAIGFAEQHRDGQDWWAAPLAGVQDDENGAWLDLQP